MSKVVVTEILQREVVVVVSDAELAVLQKSDRGSPEYAQVCARVLGIAEEGLPEAELEWVQTTCTCTDEDDNELFDF